MIIMTEEQLEKQRKRRKENGNAATNKYEKTINGFLVRKYRNMQSRVVGVQWKKAHLYFGKHLLPREDFYKWAKSCKEFYRMFEIWKDSRYERRLCPTVDRIDPHKGYFLDNMRWLTLSDNSRLGSYSQRGIKKGPRLVTFGKKR
jgi:hypothetical protein